MVGPVLDGYGFVLAPQRPADFEQASPIAYFELGVDDFISTFPGLADRMGLEVDHVDLTVQWLGAGSLNIDLEGFSLAELADLVGVEPPCPRPSLDEALRQAAATLRAALPLLR